MALNGQEQGQESPVTLSATPAPSPASITLKTPEIRASKPSWQWRERLDGSCDLYRDTETDTRHVARIVRKLNYYYCAKPAGQNTRWPDRPSALSAVRHMVRGTA